MTITTKSGRVYERRKWNGVVKPPAGFKDGAEAAELIEAYYREALAAHPGLENNPLCSAQSFADDLMDQAIRDAFETLFPANP